MTIHPFLKLLLILNAVAIPVAIAGYILISYCDPIVSSRIPYVLIGIAGMSFLAGAWFARITAQAKPNS